MCEQEGWVLKRQQGSHMIYTKAGSPRPIVIPVYDDLPPFIIANIRRQLGKDAPVPPLRRAQVRSRRRR
ncbi:MAG: type II toxin-antitoxin system HicA family toxin [Acidobacteria bacterium]|nr:type II toxin-antitoxin system HicA family toxin [Chloroflexota bacterium]MYN65118.1 type II toxin-antitoxin system HicA family toxin [Acidobacteriota bacterium]